MDWTSANLVQVIQYLLPGLVAYSLTAHPKRSPFERVVQALIFTVIVQLMTAGVRWGLEGVGQFVSIGRWTTNVAQAWSLLNASVVGVGFAAISNRNLFHSFCYHFGITSRTSHPSEWFSVFHRDKRFVILVRKMGSTSLVFDSPASKARLMRLDSLLVSYRPFVHEGGSSHSTNCPPEKRRQIVARFIARIGSSPRTLRGRYGTRNGTVSRETQHSETFLVPFGTQRLGSFLVSYRPFVLEGGPLQIIRFGELSTCETPPNCCTFHCTN